VLKIPHFVGIYGENQNFEHPYFLSSVGIVSLYVGKLQLFASLPNAVTHDATVVITGINKLY